MNWPFPCDVFDCKIKKDSSLYLIGKNEGFLYGEELVFTSIYNKEYLLTRRNSISRPKNKDSYRTIDEILPDCEIRWLDIQTRDGRSIYKDSKCDLEPLIKKFPNVNSICFTDGVYMYTLKKERNIMDKVLKLKYETINCDKYYRALFYDGCIYCIGSLFFPRYDSLEYKEYDYDLFYTTSKKEFCNLDDWKGVRLENKSLLMEKDALLDSLLVDYFSRLPIENRENLYYFFRMQHIEDKSLLNSLLIKLLKERLIELEKADYYEAHEDIEYLYYLLNFPKDTLRLDESYDRNYSLSEVLFLSYGHSMKSKESQDLLEALFSFPEDCFFVDTVFTDLNFNDEPIGYNSLALLALIPAVGFVVWRRKRKKPGGYYI